MNILINGVIENLSTRADSTLKIVIGTPELSPNEVGELFAMRKKEVFVYIKDTGISKDEIEAIENHESEGGHKTQSQRLRGVLYRLWETENEGFTEFHNFYIAKTETIINHLKSKLS
jgi:hypothetical protein